jgi:hypothetical protein
MRLPVSFAGVGETCWPGCPRACPPTSSSDSKPSSRPIPKTNPTSRDPFLLTSLPEGEQQDHDDYVSRKAGALDSTAAAHVESLWWSEAGVVACEVEDAEPQLGLAPPGQRRVVAKLFRGRRVADDDHGPRISSAPGGVVRGSGGSWGPLHRPPLRGDECTHDRGACSGDTRDADVRRWCFVGAMRRWSVRGCWR